MRVWFLLMCSAIAVPASAEMPAVEQNALVKKYCAVCHTNGARNGGLSLEHYDAAKRDPGLAAMLLSKLDNGAMGAAGIPVPAKATQQAWLESTREQTAGAKNWHISRDGSTVSVGIVRDVAPRTTNSANRPVYRLALVCNPAQASGEMHLTWSPEPQTGRQMSVSVDGELPIDYRIEGKESMGNGSAIQTGRASVVLRDRNDRRLRLAERSLIVRDVFPGETIEFPLGDLDMRVRAELRQCFVK